MATVLQKEQQTYERELPKLLAQEGKYALIHEEEVAGVFDSYADALQAGYEKFGLQPFLVKQIEAVERVHCFTREVLGCHT